MSKEIKSIYDLTGKRFGRLTAESVLYTNKYGANYWLCKCECGNLKTARASALKVGNVKSCGCYLKEQLSKRQRKHGMALTRFYKIWKGMRQRCYFKKHLAYERYGGRGIKVCEEWEEFENFRDNMYKNYLEHCEEHGTNNTSIDRIDNDKGYNKQNCRWATRKVQQNNRRDRQKKA